MIIDVYWDKTTTFCSEIFEKHPGIGNPEFKHHLFLYPRIGSFPILKTAKKE
jgi:hypothetical protein